MNSSIFSSSMFVFWIGFFCGSSFGMRVFGAGVFFFISSFFGVSFFCLRTFRIWFFVSFMSLRYQIQNEKSLFSKLIFMFFAKSLILSIARCSCMVSALSGMISCSLSFRNISLS